MKPEVGVGGREENYSNPHPHCHRKLAKKHFWWSPLSPPLFLIVIRRSTLWTWLVYKKYLCSICCSLLTLNNQINCCKWCSSQIHALILWFHWSFSQNEEYVKISVKDIATHFYFALERLLETRYNESKFCVVTPWMALYCPFTIICVTLSVYAFILRLSCWVFFVNKNYYAFSKGVIMALYFAQ